MNRTTRIINEVISLYPEAECELNFHNPYELLIATVLSAQTTDKQVNKVTVKLFEKYPTPGKLAEAKLEDVKKCIQSLGFFNTKAENIIKASKQIVEKFSGEIPAQMELLTTLPGVGRKTANVVLSNAFGIPAFAVDTHVKRVSFRLGLTKQTDPDKVEENVTSKIPKKLYTKAHHALIFHGRRVCKASNPSCNLCKLNNDCFYYRTQIKR